jgi:polyferredoxin
MNVVPRKNKRDISCVNCGACVDACHRELGKGNSLFHLGFNKNNTKPQPLVQTRMQNSAGLSSRQQP